MTAINWVQQWHQCCSVEVVATRLLTDVGKDIKAWRALRAGRGEQGIVEITGGAADFSVIVDRAKSQRGVRFRIDGKKIVVSDWATGGALMEATPVLADDGECRLKVETQELEHWQFRRRALEKLFFGEL
jgi:hypothetical protein